MAELADNGSWTTWLCVSELMHGVAGCCLPPAAETNVAFLAGDRADQVVALKEK